MCVGIVCIRVLGWIDGWAFPIDSLHTHTHTHTHIHRRGVGVGRPSAAAAASQQTPPNKNKPKPYRAVPHIVRIHHLHACGGGGAVAGWRLHSTRTGGGCAIGLWYVGVGESPEAGVDACVRSNSIQRPAASIDRPTDRPTHQINRSSEGLLPYIATPALHWFPVRPPPIIILPSSNRCSLADIAYDPSLMKKPLPTHTRTRTRTRRLGLGRLPAKCPTTQTIQALR